jgi:hypothetical protein
VIWVAWRQQRTEALIAASVIALLALLLVPTGIHMASAYDHDGLSACLGHQHAQTCNTAIDSFRQRFRQLADLLGWLTLIPGLIGVLLAAPFVLQLESGSYRLDWTQSISRRRWIAGKLGIAVAAGAVFSFAFVALLTWWRTPLVHLQGRMEPSVFDSEGVVVFGYTLFALGLALAVGVIWRRAVPALVVAFAGYFASRLFVDVWLRERLTTPATSTWPVRTAEPHALSGAWIVTEHPSDKLGHVLPLQSGICQPGVSSRSCLIQHSAGFMHAVYEPASRFWAMQTVELALFGGLALCLIALAAWWTHERTA